MIGGSVIAALALTCGMTCTVACASQPARPHFESNGSAPTIEHRLLEPDIV
jgi:hypothetical protein